jgi:transketolase C-terminal domain/subunit
MVLHGLQDVFGESGPDAALLDKYGISNEKTAAAIKGAVENR